MKATLISHSAANLDELRRHAQAEGVDVVLSVHRKQRDTLAPLVAKLQGDLLVVDCAPGTEAGDLPALEGLTRANPQLAVLVLSTQQSSDSLLAAMRAGVREVLPSQPSAAEFAAALRRIAQRVAEGGANRGRVVSFLPCKGGSGSTFIATNVAYCLATEHKKRTALLDLDLQYGDAAYFVSDGRARSNLADLARQVDRLDASLLEASMITVAPGFKLLSAPEEPEAALGVTAFQLERVIDVACANHDFVILDAERMLDPLTVKALDRSDTIFLVTENMVPHARDAKRLVRILRALGYTDAKLRLVVNRAERHEGIELDRLEEVVGLKVAHTIRDSHAEVAEAVNTGVPLVHLHPGNPVSREMRHIAASLVETAPQHHGWLDRLIGERA